MKNQRQGVRKGPSDHWVIVPTKMGFKMLVAVEMKRLKGWTVSDEQIEFLHALNGCQGVVGVVCLGAEQAIRVVEAIEHNNAGEIKDIIDFTNCLKPKKDNRETRQKSAKIRQKTTKSRQKPKNDCPF